MPSCVRAGTSTQSAVSPSSTTGFVPVSSHCARLALGPGADAVDRVAVAVLVEGDRAPGRAGGERRRAGRRGPSRRAASVASTADERNGPGQRDAAHLLEHDHHVDEAEAEAAVLLGHEQPGPAEVDQLAATASSVKPASARRRHRPHVAPAALLGEERRGRSAAARPARRRT